MECNRPEAGRASPCSTVLGSTEVSWTAFSSMSLLSVCPCPFFFLFSFLLLFENRKFDLYLGVVDRYLGNN